VLTLETRRLGPAAARRRAGAAGTRLRALGRGPACYKMDSTLRGNFAGELAALGAAGRRPLVWIAPANPAHGRWTVGGRQYLRGVPLDRTAFARDPLQPVRGADVRALAERAFGRGRVALAGLTEVRRGPARLRRLRRAWLRRGARAVVADAVTDRDLAAVAGALGPRDLPAGAAPLARHVLGRGPGLRVAPGRRSARAWMAVMGSLHPVSLEQVRVARRAGRGTVLAPARPRGRLTPRAGWRLARELAARAARLIRARRPGGVVLSGGMTAAAVCAALGIRALRLVREIEPGVVLAEAACGGGVLRVVTKPGGFGGPGALRRLLGGRP